jgi:vacuolar-type H+-ATPase subunit I/STV1
MSVDVGVVLSIGVAVSAFASFILGLFDYLRRGKKRKQTLEERIKQLTSSLEDASKVVGEVEQEIEERRELARKLEQDVETYKNVVALKKDEVEAVAQLLRGELKKEGRRGFIQNLVVNFLFFVVGVLVTFFLIKR